MGVHLGLVLGDPPLVDQALDPGVVAGDRSQLAVAEQVAPRVAEVGKPDLGPVEERGGDRRPHAVDARVLLDDLREPLVGHQDRAGQSGQQVVGRLGVQPLDGLDRDRGGQVAGRGATHPVGNHDQVGARVAGVVVLLPDPADVGDGTES